jgi:putative ABC transport system permease protein
MLSMFGIVIGVATLLAINVTNQTALDSIVKLFSDTSGKAKLSVISTDSDNKGFDEALATSIQNNPQVSIASPILKTTSDLADTETATSLDLGLFGTGGGAILIHGILPEMDTQVREYKLSEGGFLGADGAKDEIVLVEDFAKENDLDVGQWMDILTPFGFESLKIIGLITKEGPGQVNNGQFGIVHLQTAQEIFDREGELDQIDILIANAKISRQELNTLKESLQTRLGGKVSVIFPANQGERMTQMLESYQIGLNLLSGMALFVGAFLIYNSFAMTVLERTREIGMLRTIGMTSRQITLQVLLEAMILGIIGSSIGLGVGFILSRGLTRLMEIILVQTLSQVRFPAHLLFSSFLVGLFVTLFAAMIPAWQAGRISPLEALRARSNVKEGWLIRHGWTVGILLLLVSFVLLVINPFPNDPQFRAGSFTVFGLFLGIALLIPVIVRFWEPISRPVIRLVYGTSGGLGSRNIQRSRLRTTLTVAALIVGVSMVIMTKVITSSFAGDLTSWMDGYIGGDIYISSSIPMRSDLADRIKSISEVSSVVPIRYINIDWQTPLGETETISFMGFEPVDYIKVTNIIFSDPDTDANAVITQMIENDALLISSVLAELHALGPGDMVRLRTRSGYQLFPIAGVVVDFNNQGKVIQGSWNTMRRYFRVNDASIFLVKAVDPDQIALTSEKIDELYGKRYKLSIIANKEVRDQAFNLLEQAFSMFDVTSLIAIAVASLGIINTLTISVIERTREIGMLRAIGMTNRQVFVMILAEAGLIGILGAVFGILSGIMLSRVIIYGMKAMAGYNLAFLIPQLWLVVSFFAALAISQLAALLPARRAVRTEILEALHYE